MAQHINTNQLHQMAQLPMLQAAGLNLTILNNQQHHLSQFAQPGHQGMYQIVQQVQPGHGQVQLQNVVHQPHQFSNIHHMQQQQQHLQQQQHILVQSQHQQQLQQHHIQQNHQQIPQQNLQQNDNVQLTKSGKKKKSKVNKDGVPAPKRATTAYINFTQWYRDEIKKTGRTVPKIGEFGKECAAKWNSMNDEEKKPFTDVAEKDRARYRREMEVYKPARDANKPKRPGTAFMLFMVDFRKELAGKEPEGGVAALAKLGGERWRNMTDEEKKPYCEKQNECKIKYEAAMEEYRKTTGMAQVVGTGDLIKEIKSEISDSDTSEQLNNSLSNSTISNNNGNSVDHEQLNLKHDEHQIQNHNSQSPGSTSASPHTQTTSPSPLKQHQQQQQQSSLSSISTALPLQSQSFYTQANSFISNNFLEQQHEDVSYNQSIDQQLEQHQIHEGQQQDQQQNSSYLQNGGPPAYQTQTHYQWN